MLINTCVTSCINLQYIQSLWELIVSLNKIFLKFRMIWFDPKKWTDDKDFGFEELKSFATHFATPLGEASYDASKVNSEFKRFRLFVKTHYSATELDAKKNWKHALLHQRGEFPNLCLLSELITSISGSNSSVERAFSTLTNMLSDRCLKLKHKTIEDMLLIKANHKIWDEKEREAILDRTTEIYLQKRRRTKIDEPPSKVQRLSTEINIEPDSDEESTDESDIDDDVFLGDL